MVSGKEKKILLLIPAFNEEGKIRQVVSGADRNLINDILVIDDGSTDNTALEAQAYGAVVIKHRRNIGVGAALRTGIKYALERGTYCIVIMGADAQDKHSETARILKPIVEEGYDLVQGSRRLNGTRMVNAPMFRIITTKIYSLLFRLLTGFPCTDGTNGFRAIKTKIFRDPNINLYQDWLNQYELEPYILYKAVKLNYKVKEVPVTKIYHPRNIGYTKMKPIISWWSILRPLFLLSLGIKK